MAKGNSPIMDQLIKVFRHTRAGSYGTRARYQSSCSSFIQFLDSEFKMKNLRNLSDKHLVAYVEHRQLQKIAPKTIKNDLGAIRYMHDQVPRAKHVLSSNDKLDVKLEKTLPVGNRAWTDEEFKRMQGICDKISLSSSNPNQIRIAKNAKDTMILGRTMGLRITEATAMHRSQAEQALKTNMYQVKGEAKNGKWRKVPVSAAGRKVLEARLLTTARRESVFIQDQKTHEAVEDIVKFIAKHRDHVVTRKGEKLRTYKGKTNKLTFHGLRYKYIQERMDQEKKKGRTEMEAAQLITREVGHERIEILDIYLSKR